MNTERFEELRASVIEAGTIISGERNASREFRIEIETDPKHLQEVWAICLESDDPAALVPRKLYLIKYGETGVWVRDENDEMTVCDKEDFLPLSIAPEIGQVLAETV